MKNLTLVPRASLILAFLSAASLALAHDTFFEQTSPAQAGQFVVRFADEGKPLAYPPAKLKRVWAYNAGGQQVALQLTPTPEIVRISAPSEAVMMALEFENGFFSRTNPALPSIERPMNEVPGAVMGTWAKKSGKYITQWTTPVLKPVGTQLEIVPQSASIPKPGETLRVQVLWEGKPIEGIVLSKGEKDPGEKTDANGMANYKVHAGHNFIWSERRIMVQNDPRYTTLAVATNLIFVTP